MNSNDQVITTSNGYRIEIAYDQFASDPRDPREFCNLGVMVCFHGRHDLINEVPSIDHRDFSGWAAMEKHIKKAHDTAIILPIYLMDHSSISLSTMPYGCPWDSGQVGFIFVSKEALRAEFGVKRLNKEIREEGETALRAEVRAYSEYVKGETYCVLVHNADGESEEYASGFYGYNHEESGAAECMRQFIKTFGAEEGMKLAA